LTNKFHTPSRPPDEVERGISRELGKSVLMVRFFTERMLYELELGRMLSPEEQQVLSSKVWSSFPGRRQRPPWARWVD